MSANLTKMQMIGESYREKTARFTDRIIVCAGTGCVANGSLKVFERLQREIEAAGISVSVDFITCEKHEADKRGVLLSKSGCQGFCQQGTLVTLEPGGTLYNRVKVDDVPRIVAQTLIRGELIEALLYHNPASGESCRTTGDIPFYFKQQRTILKECGSMDPECIEEYISKGGYSAAYKAFTAMQPKDVCREIEMSGLRGRGGGGFPTGKKWKLTLDSKNGKKYVICNGDEGDPGAFMDRSLMEGNPHAVLEGMLIAGRAIGADEGYVYVRAEYPLAVERLKKAVTDANKMGVLGKGILGTPYNFEIRVMEGAGAFVCGEETALIASVEGKRGMPSPKPPFPAEKGLWGKPTVINNVETLATVPFIIRDGARAFRAIGTERSPGTKTFALTGHVANTGLIEVPFGTTLEKIVYDIGGGVTDKNGKRDMEGLKAVQIGGPSGGCLTKDHLQLPLDYDSLAKVGAMVGSGGLVVMNQDTCMVQVARFFMQFTQNESCGKCVMCREGTRQMLRMLDDISEGKGTLETLDLLYETAKGVAKGSLCGLGKTAPNPVLATLRYFRTELEAHVVQKRCLANQCKALVMPEIDEEKCRGCMVCRKKCPVGAIAGEKKQPHSIDTESCIRCGVCADVCKFDAVSGVR